MARRILPAAVVLLLLWLGWRVHALAEDVDLLGSRTEVLAPPPAQAPSAPASMSDAPAPRLSSKPAPPPETAGLEGRLAKLEARLRDLERTREEVEGMVAELVADRVRANEIAAIATSRNVISAQAQVQSSARCDVDADGTGEYAGFLEGSGAVPGRMASVLTPAVLSGAFRKLTPAGEVIRNGYVYRVYLPDAHGAGVGEPATGFGPGLVDPNLSETTWCMYAWPLVHGQTGTRTFFMNQTGDVLATDAPAYGGSDHGPSPDAAFLPAHRGTITGQTAVGAKGVDGNAWVQVN